MIDHHIVKTIKITLILILVFSTAVCGQSYIHGTVVNKAGLPIPYTSVYSARDSVGTYTDIDGTFYLSVKKLPVRLEFSNVGYIKETFEILIVETGKIQLKEKIQELDEVAITAKEEVIRYVGTQKSRGINGYVQDTPFAQLALMIKNKNLSLYDNAYLDRVSVKISGKMTGGTKPTGANHLRLRLYIITGNGKIGEDILNENIFLSPSKTGWYDLELAHHNIKVPQDGFVLSMEWIKDQHLEKWGKTDLYKYGLLIDGHKLKKEELDFYSAWGFKPISQKWKPYDRPETIPCFNIVLKEQP